MGVGAATPSHTSRVMSVNGARRDERAGIQKKSSGQHNSRLGNLECLPGPDPLHLLVYFVFTVAASVNFVGSGPLAGSIMYQATKFVLIRG